MFISAHTRRIVYRLAMSILILLGCSACETTPLQTAMRHTNTLNGWNDDDARVMAREVISEILKHPWKQRFTQFTGRNPVIIVGPLLNRTHDQLHTQTLIKALQHALVDSGQVQSVADAGQRQEVRQEHAEQGPQTPPDPARPAEQVLGADFILQGSIKTTEGIAENTQKASYHISLELIDIASNVKVWVGQKTLHKRLNRRGKTL